MKHKSLLIITLLSFFSFSAASLSADYNSANSALDRTLNETTKHETNVMSPVYVNTFIESLDELISYSENEASRPSNVIVRVDEEINLINSSGEKLNISFQEAYNTYIKGKMIPVIYFEGEETTNALVTYLDSILCPLDMAVCTTNPDNLKAVRSTTNGQRIRGILDLSKNSEFTKEDAVAISNSSYANTVILSETQATYENIRYIESRFKVVWVNTLDLSDLNIVKLVTYGVYGIISSEVSSTLSKFSLFANTDYPSRNMNRVPFNIGHRGTPIISYENSIEGYREAFNRGATHIETDIQLTADNKLVVMHDETIDSATNGTGYVRDLTSEQISQYKITKINVNENAGAGVDIPFLDDVFEEFKDNGKIIIIEIKDSNENIVDVLKGYMDQYDMYDQVVFISFYEDQLLKCKEVMPTVPTATLNNYSESMFTKITSDGVVSLNRKNMASDFNYGIYNATYDYKLAERGFMGFYWTFNQVSSLYNAVNSGIVGLTTDYAQQLENFGTRLVATDEVSIESNELESLISGETTINLNYEMYNGEVSEEVLEAKPVVAYKVSDGEYSMIFSAQFLGPNSTPRYRTTIFSDVIKVNVTPSTQVDEPDDPVIPDEPIVEDPAEPESPNNLGLILGISIPLGVIALGGIAVGLYLFYKKKK